MAVISFAAHCADIFCLVADDRLTADRIVVGRENARIAENFIAVRIHANKRNSYFRCGDQTLQNRRLLEILRRRSAFERREGNRAACERRNIRIFARALRDRLVARQNRQLFGQLERRATRAAVVLPRLPVAVWRRLFVDDERFGSWTCELDANIGYVVGFREDERQVDDSRMLHSLAHRVGLPPSFVLKKSV